jgi:hypothetical protein
VILDGVSEVIHSTREVQTLTETGVQSSTTTADNSAPEFTREPVFVLAAPHSLSSLLCAALGQHPDAYATPGLHLLTRPIVRESVAFAQGGPTAKVHGLLRTIAQLYSGEQTIESIDMARRWLRRRSESPGSDVQRELCRRIAPRTLVERCAVDAATAAILPTLVAAFPHARFIYLVRHPFAQGRAMLSDLESVGALMRRPADAEVKKASAVDPQFAWFEAQVAILDFLDARPKDLQWHLRVEDLAAHPAALLRDLCEWLGLTWSPEILAAMLAFEHSPFYRAGPYNAPAGYDPALRTLSPWRPLPDEEIPLEGALPWRKDKRGLAPHILELAQALGYGSPPSE